MIAENKMGGESMKKRKIRNSKKVNDAVEAWRKGAKSNTDTLGSYTGIPVENGIMPEQDADDL